MATDNSTNSTTDSTDETSGQETQDQQQATTPETGATGEQQQSTDTVTIDVSPAGERPAPRRRFLMVATPAHTT